jgi:glycosidase
MLLPGTTIIYYGDEIGMANTTNISFEDTRDPYARPPYANETTFKKKSRDPFRTPMHVSHLPQK